MLELIKPSDLKALKDLSLYLLFPSFTCASVIENISKAPLINDDKITLLWEWFLFIGGNFIIISIFIFLFFVIFILLSAYIVTYLNFKVFVPIIATTLLSYASVGLMIHWLQLENISLPINQFWFISCVILSFNLYKLEENQQNQE